MDEKRFTLRMDGELFEEIASLASKHRRSTAKEIECAVARYISSIKEKELLDTYDRNNTDNEVAKDYIRRHLEIVDKYKAYEEDL